MPVAATATASRNVNSRPTIGIMDAIRSTLGTTAKLVRTRLDIISTELEEQREWLQNLVLYGLAGIFLISMGLVLVTLFVVVLFWESHRTAVLGGFSALYLGLGIFAIVTFKNTLHKRPKLFAATTAELAKDEAQLTPRR
jgi:uncharacterized membrane protein YqjE